MQSSPSHPVSARAIIFFFPGIRFPVNTLCVSPRMADACFPAPAAGVSCERLFIAFPAFCPQENEQLFVVYGRARFFFPALVALVFKHPDFLAVGAFSLPPPDFLDGLLLLAGPELAGLFDLFAEFAAGEVAVHALRAFSRAFDLCAGWFVQQVDARGGLVELLPAPPTAPDELFLDVGFA